MHAQNIWTYTDEWPVRRGFVHRTQLVRYVRPQYGNGLVAIRWYTSHLDELRTNK